MAKLILSMDGLVLKEIPITKERTTVGRKPHNDIQIDNLAISGDHAAIIAILDDAFLEDLNSTNGTYVNGQPVKKIVLKDQDVVELGKYRLKYLKDAQQLDRSSTFEKAFVPVGGARALDSLTSYTDAIDNGEGRTITIRGGNPITLDNSAEPLAPVSGGTIGVLQVLTGRNAGRALELSKASVTLGKPGSQVAVITRRSQDYFITHVEGEALPIVNGKQLGSSPLRLADQDIIEIAGVEMAFFFRALPSA